MANISTPINSEKLEFGEPISTKFLDFSNLELKIYIDTSFHLINIGLIIIFFHLRNNNKNSIYIHIIVFLGCREN